ncbi:hypothetical protein [Spiroplasma sp. AdecLV25b]|uniref:hypothetical protein n=1 Tax=Spiroplasma sp. AdecLV25b TaxID=3027162 RepID=UPI0027E1C65C|nr:hypothetical protein [Spiroplasma sp. AdecLV25b]
MKSKYHKNHQHNLPTKMAIILGASKIVIGISILFACIMLLVIHTTADNILPQSFNIIPF